MIKKTVRLALFTSMILLNVSPVVASTVDVVGNGADSSNQANVSVSKTTNIYQSNIGSVQNSVTVTPNTGDNVANKNTGGDTSISTGDAAARLAVNNDLNHNTSLLNCCNADGFTAKISGNGADSDNNINLNLVNNLSIVDQKTLTLHNKFDLDPNTGRNNADKNTGGDTRISTGDANAMVTIGNVGNINTIVVGNVNPPSVTPVPGTTTLPNPPVTATPASTSGQVMGLVNQLPNTGFDYSLIVLIVTGLIGSGLVLRSKSEELDNLVRSVIVRV